MELREFFTPIIRWWWLLLAAAGVAAGFSWFIGQQQPPVYQTNTTMMIGRAIEDPNPSDLALYTSQQLASTYADIVARQPVREATMKALG